MTFSFEKYASKGNEIVKEAAQAVGDPDGTDRAASILRSVLHALKYHDTRRVGSVHGGTTPCAKGSIC